MNQFTIHILFNNHLLKICFSRIVGTREKYFVELTNPAGNPTQFEVQKDTFDPWKLLHPVPDWVIELESQLHTVLSSRLG